MSVCIYIWSFIQRYARTSYILKHIHVYCILYIALIKVHYIRHAKVVARSAMQHSWLYERNGSVCRKDYLGIYMAPLVYRTPMKNTEQEYSHISCPHLD